MIWVTIILGVIILYLLSMSVNTKTFPPGPKPLPIIGNILSLKPIRCVALKRFSETYGDVFTVKLFGNRVVVLSSIKAIRSALIDNGNVFLFRIRTPGLSSVIKDKGILNGDGQYWQDHRRFALKTLRDFGFAKAVSNISVHAELQSMIETLEKQNGEPFSTKMPFAKMTTNVICRMVFGQRLSEDEEQCEVLLKLMINIITNSTRLSQNLVTFFPALDYIPFFTKMYNHFNSQSRNIKIILGKITKIIQKHRSTISDISEPRDFIDALILNKNRLDEQNIQNTFDEESMAMDVLDLFAAGTDTTSVTLSWGMLLMATNPEIQAKVRQEIQEQLGTERFSTTEEKSKLNYTLAVIDEVQRYASVVPSALLHRNGEDIEICGQLIPKHSRVLPSIYCVHRDEALWKYPNAFNPENFLDDEGNYKASTNLIQFSLGKRACLGESLARLEVFVFFVGILQRFRVTFDQSKNIPLEELLIGMDGIIRHLKEHKLIFVADV